MAGQIPFLVANHGTAEKIVRGPKNYFSCSYIEKAISIKLLTGHLQLQTLCILHSKAQKLHLILHDVSTQV